MPRIKVIQQEEADGRLKEIYDDLIKKRGKLAEVHKIQSLRPESITAHMDLYMEIMYSRSELSRAERELIGTTVSLANGCRYCTTHHSNALNHYWKNNKKIRQLINKEYAQILNHRELSIVRFANLLTEHPERHENSDFTQALKDAGLSDSGILDVVLVTAYFNFVNRIVLALDTNLEPDNGGDYKY